MLQRLQYLAGTEEPVSVEEAQLAARLDDALATYVGVAIAAARQQAEQITGRIYRGQKLREELEAWPDGVLRLAVYQATALSIEYRSAASPDAWTVLNTSLYRWTPNGAKTEVRLADGQSWPELATEDYGVRVRVTVEAGATSVNDVPESVRLYIMASVTGWADEPGSLIAGNLQANPHFERLLDAERLWV